MLFKALKHITCEGKEHAPGDIIPGATSFPNLREMIDWRYIGYATEDEIKAYEAKKAEEEKALAEQTIADEAAKKAEEDKAAKQEKSSK